jgi:hypothetical protein
MSNGRQRTPFYPLLALSVYGIRTHGSWQKIFAELLSGSTKVKSWDFGRYGLIRFKLSYFNNRKIDQFHEWYSNAVNTCPEVQLDRFDKRPSMAAHSFGTWIVCNAMLKYSEIRFDKLLLCASILPTDFDWAKLFARDQVAIVQNECGHKDPWPKLCYRYAPGTGRSGAEGFEWFDSLVNNKHYDYHTHSDFLSLPHMTEHWLPFFHRPPNPLAIRHGRDVQSEQEFLNIFADTDQLDIKAFGKKYDSVYVTDDMALGWIRANPDIYTFLIDRRSQKTVGYLNAPPLNSSMYKKLRRGRANDNDISGADIVSYDNNQTVKIYLMSVVIDEDYRQLGQGPWHQAYVQLIGGFLDKLTDYAKHKSIFATHLLATAWTDEGERICKSLGMEPVGRDKFGDRIYEVDLATVTTVKGLLPALARLLSVYKKTNSH